MTTSLNVLGFSLTVVLACLLFVLPRRLAFVPLIMAACFLPLGQRIVIFGLNFFVLRILITCGWIRAFSRGEFRDISWSTADWLVFAWIAYSVVSYTVLYGTGAALINRLGFAFVAIGLYSLGRAFIRTQDDVQTVCRWLFILIVPLTGIMLSEYGTGKNLFVYLGAAAVSMVREGRPRCSGPFSHAILAGCFGAALVPLFIGYSLTWRQDRKIGWIGCICSTAIVFMSGSSGPLVSFVSALVGMLLWPMRANMRRVRWALVIAIFFLSLVMKAPVYFLMARLGDTVGGHGYHRAEVIEQAIVHRSEWWLLGTTNTAKWLPFAVLPSDPTMIDVTNQFVLQGVNGGVVNLLLFVAIIVVAFRQIGKGLRGSASAVGGKEVVSASQIVGRNTSSNGFDGKHPDFNFMIWGMGSALATHLVNFMNVTYFDQNLVMWFMLLAFIGTLDVNLTKGEAPAARPNALWFAQPRPNGLALM